MLLFVSMHLFMVLCIAFLYAVGVFISFLGLCVVFVSPRGCVNTIGPVDCKTYMLLLMLLLQGSGMDYRFRQKVVSGLNPIHYQFQFLYVYRRKDVLNTNYLIGMAHSVHVKALKRTKIRFNIHFPG